MFRNTGVDDLVEKYNTGIVIDFNSTALEAAIRDIACNIPYWRTRSLEIKKIYREYFSWDIMEKRLLNIYCNK